jgi:hypothetical protein
VDETGQGNKQIYIYVEERKRRRTPGIKKEAKGQPKLWRNRKVTQRIGGHSLPLHC